MLEIIGKHYYIDINEMISRCIMPDTEYSEEIDESQSDEKKKALELNIFKYEILKSCVERILMPDETEDDDMDLFTDKKMDVSYKLAFNTLIKNKILIEDDEQ